MLFLFLVVGIVVGSASGAFVLWSGGSILFALVSYSLFGTLSATGVVLFVFYLGELHAKSVEWNKKSDTHDPLSV